MRWWRSSLLSACSLVRSRCRKLEEVRVLEWIQSNVQQAIDLPELALLFPGFRKAGAFCADSGAYRANLTYDFGLRRLCDHVPTHQHQAKEITSGDRKSVVQGKSVDVGAR